MSDSSPNYSQINGFYGCGTWWAWVITLIASWIPILRKDYKNNLHYISYALYTNWATIDLIRQGSPSAEHRTFREMNDAQLQSLVPAEAVVRVGIFQACLQIATCRYIATNKDADTKKNITRRLRCIAIGLILPVLTEFFLVPYYHNVLAGHSTSGYLKITVAALVATYMFLTQISASLSSTYALSDLVYYTFIPSSLVSLTNWSYFTDSNADLRKLCFYIPCAPQKIGEWDQAFSLVVALFFFLYELVDWAVQSMREFGQQAVE